MKEKPGRDVLYSSLSVCKSLNNYTDHNGSKSQLKCPVRVFVLTLKKETYLVNWKEIETQ
jgi:hypothetical protein